MAEIVQPTTTSHRVNEHLVSRADMTIAVSRWAASKPEIRLAWLYGSRVKGTATETSDWDVAISLGLGSADANRRFWFDVIDGWNTELADIAGCDIELQLNNRQ